MTCSTGDWDGYPAPTFTYQWLLDGEPINRGDPSSQQAIIYLDNSELGLYTRGMLSCQVTATNVVGDSSCVSASVEIFE